MTDSSEERDVTHSKEILQDCHGTVTIQLGFIVTNFVRRIGS